MSSTPPPPHKTALGHEELRQRTRRFSQRHRTVLLLVDGKRGRDEVLVLAEKAGASVTCFDDLVDAGLIDVAPPPVERPVASSVRVRTRPDGPEPLIGDDGPEAIDTEFPDVDLAVIEETARSVLGELGELPALAEVAAVARRTAPPSPLPQPVPAPAPFERSVPVPLVEPAGATAALAVRPARMKFAPPMYRPPQVDTGVPPLVHDEVEPVRSRASARAAEFQPSAGGEPDGIEEALLLAEVRSLLIGTLLVDGPVSSSLNVLRVGRARDRYELVGLVWQIERALIEARRPREALARLRRARELLGLGNTLVHEDTAGRASSSFHDDRMRP